MLKKKGRYIVAVVGATGAVGNEMIATLEQRDFPVERLRLFASERSEGKTLEFHGSEIPVEALNEDSFKGIDIALFSAGAERSSIWAPIAAKSGCVVIDNSSQWRMDPEVPLVVPEVNASDLKWHKGIIANPNCSTIQMVVALWPVYKKAGIKRVIVTTFQAASGAGRSAVEQLKDELKRCSAGESLEECVKALPQRLAFNVFPHIGNFGEYDYTSEEWKLVSETHKIMHDNKIKISATAVRVPVGTGHSEAVYIETKKEISPEKIREILKNSSGIKIIDDPKSNLYPMPKDAEGKDEVFVGRVRKDPFVKNGLWLWVVADNLRKGAATNAVQIAECVISGLK